MDDTRDAGKSSKKKYNLTNEDTSIALYPKVSGDGSKIVYHTIDGQVFLLEIKTKD